MVCLQAAMIERNQKTKRKDQLKSHFLISLCLSRIVHQLLNIFQTNLILNSFHCITSCLQAIKYSFLLARQFNICQLKEKDHCQYHTTFGEDSYTNISVRVLKMKEYCKQNKMYHTTTLHTCCSTFISQASTFFNSSSCVFFFLSAINARSFLFSRIRSLAACFSASITASS